MQRNNSISWIEILIIDLALILAIGAMGSKPAERGADTDGQPIASSPATTVLASR